MNARGDQRLMLWSTPNLNVGERRSTIPLADLGEARFRLGGGNALPPGILAHLRSARHLSTGERKRRSVINVMVHS